MEAQQCRLGLFFCPPPPAPAQSHQTWMKFTWTERQYDEREDVCLMQRLLASVLWANGKQVGRTFSLVSNKIQELLSSYYLPSVCINHNISSLHLLGFFLLAMLAHLRRRKKKCLGRMGIIKQNASGIEFYLNTGNHLMGEIGGYLPSSHHA